MTLLINFLLAKISPPNEVEINDNREENDGDIDRWENDGGMNSGTIYDRSRN